MMDTKEMLLRKISAAQFAAWEIHIYLDTHPNDTKALESYKKYQAKALECMKQYEERFGPLRPVDAMGDTRWEWVNSPWPWENCDEEALHNV